MTTIDGIRKLAAMGLVVAAGAYLHVGVGAQLALAQTNAPGGYVGFGPNHETEQPGMGIPTAPVVPQFGIGPVLPGPASPHARTSTSFFPMVKDSRLTFGSALAADSVAIGGFSGLGMGGYGGLGMGGYGGLGMGGYGGLGMGGYGGLGMGGGVIGAPGMYGSWGGPSTGLGLSLPPTPELGGGAYRAGNQLPGSTVGMGTGVGNPAAPAAGNAGRSSIGVPSEDAFDNAANGGPPPTRPVRSKRVKAARRPALRKPTAQPYRKVEAKVTDAVPRRLEVPGARPQQANIPQEKPSAVKSEGTKPAPKRSMLGP